MAHLSRFLCLLACLSAHFSAHGENLSLSFAQDRGRLLLSWPAWAADGVLEQSTNPGVAEPWTVVPRDLYQADETGFKYWSTVSTGRVFYRVRRLNSPVPDLICSWPLEQGTAQGSPAYNGVAAALQLTNITWAAGRIGRSSLRFNGQSLNTGGSQAWADNTGFQVLPPEGRPFSLSLWFNPDDLPIGVHELLGNSMDGTNRWRVTLTNLGPGTNFLSVTEAGSASSIAGRTLLVPGEWHQLVLTSAGDRAGLCLDGRLLAEGPLRLLNGPGRLYLAAAGPDLEGFRGRMDELRVYTNALTTEQISLAGQWHFDESTGRLAADSSIQGHLAAIVDPAAWVAGKSGSGIDLSAGDLSFANEDYALLPPAGGPFSISLWVSPRALPLSRSLLLSCTDDTNRGWQVTLDADVSAQPWLEFSSTSFGGTLALRTPVPLTNGAWTKLDLTYNGAIASVYANGQKLKSEPGAIQAARAPLKLGAVRAAAGFSGVVDQLRVYNRELQAAEIGPVALPVWEMALANSSTNLLLQGSSPPGKPRIFSILSTPVPARGTIQYSPTSPVITYAAGGLKGPDTFVYTVSDGEFVSPPATGVVSVVQPHWLSPNGGPVSPRDGTSPERAWAAGTVEALNAIWQTNNHYDCFFYSAGQFQTTGWKHSERITANPGCKHIGSGSEGPDRTIIQLVNTWEAWTEGLIFGGSSAYTDGFEVHNLVLDCNADNNPKHVLGEPIWLRVPLTATTRVDKVTLRWADPSARASPYQLGRAAELTLSSRSVSTDGYITNATSLSSTGLIDTVDVGRDTDELLIWLTRRANDVSYYGLREMEVEGATVSLPEAKSSAGGQSLLDPWHSIVMAVDKDTKTSWASGSEPMVQITLPLVRGSRVSHIQLHWNCQTLPDLRRLGPASAYALYARDVVTGQLNEVPFFSDSRKPDGRELVTFGNSQVTNAVTTDELTLVLALREQGVDHYSLREVSLHNGSAAVPLRIPSAMNALGTHTLVRAFDGDSETYWASGTQGAVAAVDVGGSNLKFTGLKVMGFGTKAGRECFPLAILGPTPSPTSPPFRNVLVEDCLFTQPATNSTDGVTVVSLLGQSPGGVINGIVRRCTVRGVRAHFSYSHAFTALHVENCVVDDCYKAVYFEPQPGAFENPGPVLIRNNRFFNVMRGVTIDSHPGARFDSLVCLDNEITLATGGAQAIGISVCDACGVGPSATLTNLVVLNNIVRYPDWGPRPSSVDGGLFYGNIHHAVYGNNLLALGNSYALRLRPYPSGWIVDKPPPEDCDNPRLVIPGPSSYPPSVEPPPPGYRRAWFNNRDLSGIQPPVLYSEWGSTRLSSQQQWASELK